MTNASLAPAVTLANGVQMPALGLGTWPMDDAEAERVLPIAIEAGYRLVDTAENYRNEGGVGRGIRTSGIARDQLFVTTKFNKAWHGYDEVQTAFDNSAKLLGLDYIDLLLIDWPNPAQDRYVDAWRGMLRLLEQDKVRAIGVSNFKSAHIDRLLEATGVAPHVNQVQLNPKVPRREQRKYDAAHGIITETWSPMDQGRGLLDSSVVAEVAGRLGRTPAQVVLRWHVQQCMVPIPKSSNAQRLRENIDVFNFELSAPDLAALDSLDTGAAGVDSDAFGH